MTRKVWAFALLFLLSAMTALAGDINGKWTAQFDTQIGTQKYTFEFHVDGTRLTGKAVNEQFGTTEITEGKVDGDTITFIEPLNFQGNELRIIYTGRIDGDTIKFTRKVGDFATEELTATRVK
jgi:hypothetical protein